MLFLQGLAGGQPIGIPPQTALVSALVFAGWMIFALRFVGRCAMRLLVRLFRHARTAIARRVQEDLGWAAGQTRSYDGNEDDGFHSALQ